MQDFRRIASMSAMHRRQTLALLTGAAALAPLAARAQQNPKAPLVGFLHPGVRVLGSATMDALRRDMGEAGLIDGKAVRLEERWGGGDPGRVAALARELVALGPAVIIAVARSSIDAVLAETRIVPVVGNDLENDPVALGYAASLGKPGGNLTGLFLDAPAICGKWLQQIAELVPNLGKLAVLWDAATGPYQRDAFLAAAKAASLEAVVIEFRSGTIDAVLDAGLPADAQALVQLGSPLINQSGARLAAVAARHRLPAISPFRTFADGGGLVSYGVDLQELYRRLVPFVIKVLRGARPGDLPIEQPTKFELVVNLKAATSIGLTVPPKFRLSADDVIE
jgi:putative ABC transport system substrate-binding protein